MDLSGAAWRKSSYSGEDGGAWIEIAFLPGSKEGSDPDSPALIFTPDEWGAFTAGVNDGEFDLE
jgi:hypothetical protein